ncbi:Epimerase family protein Rv2216, partial [Durusdinium trenchii]
MASLPTSERPRVLINASGVHAYGDRGDEPLTEDAGWGDGFLADLVRAWEAAARPAESAGVRVVFARFGMVLGAGGGALKALLTPTKFGLGGPIGTGRQWWPWIGLDDAIGAVHHALLHEDLHGAVNVCAPDAATANDVSSAIADAARRPAVLGLPAGAARTVLGEEMAGDMLLASTRAEPMRLGEAGFRWMHPTLMDAIGRQPMGHAHEDRAYLLIGGAGGIGTELARRLTEAGAKVTIAGRDADKAKALADEVDAHALDALDARDADAVAESVKAAAEHHGRLDGAVSLPGTITLKPAHLTSPEELRETVETNLYTAFNLVRSASQ